MAASSVVVSSLLARCLDAVASQLSIYEGELEILPANLKKKLVHLLGNRGRLSDASLSKLLHPSISELNLRDSELTDQGLLAAGVCKYLRKLDLNASRGERRGITENGLVQVAKSCSFLQIVYLRRCVNVTDAAIASLSEHCKQLTELNIGGCFKITDLSLQSLARNSSQLCSLNVSRTQVTDDGVIYLASGCCAKSLTELHIAHCRGVTDESVEALVTFCPEIRILIFHGCPQITERSRQALEELMISRGYAVKQLTWTVY